MIAWELVERVERSGSRDSVALYRRGDEFSIRSGARELMNSRAHGSEQTLASLACTEIRGRARPAVLIGGLGMGYTLAAALSLLPTQASVLVAEVVPTVVAWNRGPLASLAGRPLRDRRVRVREIDVVDLIRTSEAAFDAILLDIDNGPEAITLPGNAWIYGAQGLGAITRALRPRGVLAVWSASPERSFTGRLRRAGFEIAERRVPARGAGHGGRFHTVWIARPRVVEERVARRLGGL